jgi:hypothetical protein
MKVPTSRTVFGLAFFISSTKTLPLAGPTIGRNSTNAMFAISFSSCSALFEEVFAILDTFGIQRVTLFVLFGFSLMLLVDFMKKFDL